MKTIFAIIVSAALLAAQNVSNITIDFTADGGPYEITAPGEIKNSAGGKALVADTTGGTSDWNEFFTTAEGLFPAKSIITIRFSVETSSLGEKARGYALVRSKANPKDQRIWIDITNTAPEKKEITVTMGGAGDYRLIFGMHKQGVMKISGFRISITPVSALTATKLPNPARTITSPGMTAYHLDAINGNDANAGTSASHAWKTLAKINSVTLAAGDSVLFARGGVWNGAFAPAGSGSAEKPVIIGSFGSGPKPIIMAEEKDQATIYVYNMPFVEIRDLEIVNKGALSGVTGSLRYGVYIAAQGAGSVKHIYVSNLTVHDVNGSVIKNSGRRGTGIHAETWGGEKKSWYDDLRIESCEIYTVDRNGITTGSAYYSPRKAFTPHSNVIIRNNVLRDIGGDGIVPIGCDGALIERNVVSDCHIRSGRHSGEYSAGIWPWSCYNTLLQYNEAYNTHFTSDGQGFDCDYNCSNTIFQYNYSHDNEGGFMLICNQGSARESTYNIGNIGPIIRYNISQNDGERIFAFGGPCLNTKIYNNTIYMTNPKLKYVVKVGSWEGWATNVYFYNNIFYDLTDATYDFGQAVNVVFSHNVFFGKSKPLPDDPNRITLDPRLIDPGKASKGWNTVTGYRLKAGSPCIGSGMVIEDNGGKDYFGTTIPAVPSRGACEYTGR